MNNLPTETAAEPPAGIDNCPPLKVGIVGWGLCVVNALFYLLWAGRFLDPMFLEGPLIPCVAIALTPGTLCALLFRHRFCFTLYRLCFAVALVVYLVEKKTLNPEQIWTAMTNWQYVIPGIVILAAPVFICAWRWQLLLRGQNIYISFWALARLLIASYFFTTFIPGANGGDFFRLFTLAKKDQLSTTAVTTSVVLDHFLGMPALMLLVLTGVALNYFIPGDSDAYTRFHYLLKVIGFCAGGGFVAFCILLCGSLFLHSLTSRLEARIPGGRALAKITAALAVYRERSGLIFAAAVISLIMHLMTLAAFVFFGQATGIEGISFSQYLFLVFTGLAANYIPVSPGGVGVGELGMETVFSMAPPFLESNGAHAATMMVCYRIGMLFYGLIGSVLYVFGKHAVKDEEIRCGNS